MYFYFIFFVFTTRLIFTIISLKITIISLFNFNFNFTLGYLRQELFPLFSEWFQKVFISFFRVFFRSVQNSPTSPRLKPVLCLTDGGIFFDQWWCQILSIIKNKIYITYYILLLLWDIYNFFDYSSVIIANFLKLRASPPSLIVPRSQARTRRGARINGPAALPLPSPGFKCPISIRGSFPGWMKGK